MKFGGTSMADIARIRNAATRVKREFDAGHQVAVVVSAMAGTTNQLVKWCNEVDPLHDAREYDAVVATGEQITAGLLAMALQSMGVPARSWQGWQVAIRTDGAHGRARVDSIDSAALLADMAAGRVAVIAGFQGVVSGARSVASGDGGIASGAEGVVAGRISTLGRGGSDLSAVAIAAVLGAERCDIYTDVDGIYTTDPRIVKSARKLEKISFEEMLELASVGAKVLQTRSVELAMKHGVRIQVLSSFSDAPGSFVVSEDEIVEKLLVSGVAYSADDAKVTLRRVPDRPGIAARLFGALASAHVNVDMIVQNLGADGTTDMTFTVGRADLARAQEVLQGLRGALEYEAVVTDPNVVKISVVGIGMRSHAGVAATMFDALSAKNINIQVISTSEIKVSVLIEAAYKELAVRALHTAFGLDGPMPAETEEATEGQ